MKLFYIFTIVLFSSSTIFQFKCFYFSVIMEIYNTGRYLDKSIGSILNQTIGYKEIQIILINDGSTDNSEEICLKYQKLYSNNVIYLKTENNGVSKARNLGMELIKGEFINFLDPDDYWDTKAFEYVLSFFRKNEEINFVSGRLKFFEARNDFHPLDYKFYKTRIVNLTEEYNCIQSSSSTSFFRASYISGKKFEEGILSGEDTRFVNDLLLINPIMGLIREAIYFCRRREDFSSRTQTQRKDVKFYFSTIENVSQYLINKSKALYNKILPFIQFYISYDLLFRIQTLSYKYLNSLDYIKYCNSIENLLQNLEDKYILEQKNVNYKYIILALSKKYKRDLRYDIILENDFLKYLDYIIVKLKEDRNIIIWRKIYIENNQLHLEGIDNIWLPMEKYFYFCVLGNKTFVPKTLHYPNNDFNSLFGLINKGKIHIFKIPLENIDKQTFSIYFSYMNNNSEIFPIQGFFSNLPSTTEGYYLSGNYIIKIIEKRLTLYKYNINREYIFETQYCDHLKKLGKNHIIQLRRENKRYRRRYQNKIEKKEIWIISDGKKKAGDNGEYFFRYLRNTNPVGIKTYFAIQKNCSDYQRLKKLGNILDLNSYEFLNNIIKSDKIISSEYNLWVDNPFGKDQQFIRDLFHFTFVFMGTGIIKDDLSNYLHRFKINIDILVTSTKKEYNSILSSNYGYNKDNLLLTGLPRFDNLENFNKNKINNQSIKKIILVIPTWRLYIKENKNSLIYESLHSETFIYTKFFNFYNSLINDQKLLKVMKKYNYTGVFCLHQYFSAQWIDFTKNQQFTIKNICNYQELLFEGSLLITDYSSIFFDFGYLKKPIIYTHFDYEEYRKNSFPEGYFSYKIDGFGPIYYNVKSTVDSIIRYIKNSCLLNIKYLRRINSFFTFYDEHNNDRLYKEIIQKGVIIRKEMKYSSSIYSIICFIIFVALKFTKIIYIWI